MTTEILKNVYVSTTVVELLDDPRKWLKGRSKFPIKEVGGLHNLSTHDKESWALNERGPLRLVEGETGREEVWYPPNQKNAPAYISVDSEGNLQSHLRYELRVMPAFSRERHERPRTSLGFCGNLNLWYNQDTIHHEGGGPAIQATKLTVPIQDDASAEYIQCVIFEIFSEYWQDGEWKATTAEGMEFVFSDDRFNTEKNRQKAKDWIAKHCTGGFHPMGDNLFLNEEEEMMFIADICS